MYCMNYDYKKIGLFKFHFEFRRGTQKSRKIISAQTVDVRWKIIIKQGVKKDALVRRLKKSISKILEGRR